MSVCVVKHRLTVVLEGEVLGDEVNVCSEKAPTKLRDYEVAVHRISGRINDCMRCMYCMYDKSKTYHHSHKSTHIALLHDHSTHHKERVFTILITGSADV